MGADYSFELVSIVHWVPQFIGHNKIFLGSVFSWPFTKIVLMRKKLPDAHIRWTIQFILNHKKANMWRKEKINIEKKNNRTKNPPISTQVIQKKICPFLQPWYPKTKRKKNKQQTWKNTKNTMKKNERKHASLYVLNIYWKKRQKMKTKKILASTEE